MSVLLQGVAEWREITISALIWPRFVVSASVMPSAR